MDLGTKKKLLDDERHYIKDILKNKIKVIKVTTIAKKAYHLQVRNFNSPNYFISRFL